MDVTQLAIQVNSTGITESSDKLDKLASSASSTEQAVGSLSSTVQKESTAMAGALGLVSNAISDVTKLLAIDFSMQGLRSAISNAMEAADAYSLMGSRLQALIGDTETAIQVQSDLVAMATSMHTSLDTLQGAYTRLNVGMQALGYNTSDVEMVTARLAAAMQIGGASTNAAAGAILQFSHAIDQGKMNAREFNSIAAAAPELLQAIAKEAGVSFGQLRQEMQKGQISTQILVKALEDYGGEWEKQSKNMPITFGKAMQDLATNTEVFIGKLNQSTGASNAFASVVEFVGRNVSNIAHTIGVVLAGAFTYLATTSIAPAVSALYSMVTAEYAAFDAALLLTGGIKSVQAALLTMVRSNPWILLITTIATAAAAVYTFGNTAEESLDKVKSKIAEIKSSDLSDEDKTATFTKSIQDQEQHLVSLTNKMQDLQKERDIAFSSGDYDLVMRLNKSIEQQQGAIDLTTESVKAYGLAATKAVREVIDMVDKATQKILDNNAVLEAEVATHTKFTNLQKQAFMVQKQLGQESNELQRAHLQQQLDALNVGIALEKQEKAQEQATRDGISAKKSAENAYKSLSQSVDLMITKYNEELNVGKKISPVQAEINKINTELAGKLKLVDAAERESLVTRREQLVVLDQMVTGYNDAQKAAASLQTQYEKEEVLREEQEKRVLTQKNLNAALQEQISKTSEEVYGITKSKEALAQLNVAKQQALIQDQEDAIAKDQLAIAQYALNDNTEKAIAKAQSDIQLRTLQIEQMKQQIPLLQQMVYLGKMQDVKTTTDEIGNLLTQSLANAFEHGKDSANKFWDNVKNLVKQKLEVQISAEISQSLIQTLNNYFQQSGNSSNGAGSGSNNFFSTMKSLWDAYQNSSSGGGAGSGGSGDGAAAASSGNSTMNSFFSSFSSMFGGGGSNGANGAQAGGATGQTGGMSNAGTMASAAAIAMNLFNSIETHKGWGQTAGSIIGMYWGPIGSMIGSAIGSMIDKIGKGGGPKQGGSYMVGQGALYPASYTEHGADTQMQTSVTQLQKTIDGLIVAYGGKAGDKIGMGFSMDPQGKAQTIVVSRIVDANGKTIYSGENDNAGRSKDELNTALATESKRVTLLALKDSNLPKEYADILNSVDIKSATADQIEQLTSQIELVKQLDDAFGQLAVVMPQLSNLTVDTKTQITNFFGGVSQFGTALGQYYKDFYSASEQQADALKMVKSQFDALGVAMPATRDEFRKLVEAQDLSTTAGQQMYAQLIALAPAFAGVTTSIAATQSVLDSMALVATDSTTGLKNLQSSISGIATFIDSVNSDIATIMVDSGKKTQQEVYDQLIGEDYATVDSLYQSGASMADVLAAATQLKTDIMDRYKYEQQNAQNMIDYAKQLQDYTRSLLTGDLSPGSMETQLAAAKSQYQATLLLARQGDATAQKNLQSQADTLLKLGKQYYASGSGYSSMFSDVTGDLNGVAAQTLAQAQSQTTALGSMTQIASDTLAQLQGIKGTAGQIQASLQAQSDNLVKTLSDSLTGPDSMAQALKDLPKNIAEQLITLMGGPSASSRQKNAGGAGVGGLFTQDQINAYVKQQGTNYLQDYEAAAYYGVTESQLATALGVKTSAVSDWISQQGLQQLTGIPKFATGGVVNSATLAVVGEAGAEAMVPLKNGGIPVHLSGAGMNADVVSELQQLREEVVALREESARQAQTALAQKAAIHKQTQDAANAQVNATKQIVSTFSTGGRRV